MPASRDPGLLTINALAMIVVSACGLIVEITAGRMLAPYVGMSLYSWTAIIAVVLAGFSLGHWLGGWIADSRRERAYRALAACMAAGMVATGGSLWLIRVVSGPVLATATPAALQITLLSFLLFFLPSFFAGVPSPVLAKISVEGAPERSGRRLGLIFAASAIGAIAGTLLAGFLFISWIGTKGTLLTVTAAYAGLALLFLALGQRFRGRRATIGGLLLSAAALTFWLQALPSPCDRESDYYCIRTVDISNDVGTAARLMILDHLGHGTNVRDDPGLLLSPYVELMDLLAKKRRPEDQAASTFFIGGGAYTLPRAWSRSATSVTVAEIDPAVTEVAVQDFWLDPDTVKIHHEDARRSLGRQAPASYDIIVGDAFKDVAVPSHLITQEFFELIRSRLRPDGLYLMNLVDHGTRLQALYAVVRTLATVFPTVEVWLEADQVRAGKRITFVIRAASRASDSGIVMSPSDPQRRYLRWPADELARQLAQGPALILTDDLAPIDRLMGYVY